MDPERSHGGSSSSSSMSDLFICFTSGPSSSSSSSFGRRLMRSNGSMKGGQASPMFSNGKKKSSGFENPEPSSPKVTCIGQVRVKSKKQGKKFRACRSKRTGMDHNNGSNNNSQECKKWVHLPLTICEALRAFGAEYFYCFLPSCMTNQREDKQDKTEARSGDNDDDDDEKRKSSERHAFEDIEINDDEDEEDEARLSISCIPPKDALLLTRCRSDPIKMAAFANKFLDLDPKNEEQNPEAETNAGESKEEQGNDEDADQQESTIKEQTLNLHGEENVQEKGSTSMVEEEEKTQERSELDCTEAMKTDQEGDESKESESQQNLLPDCLLLMMCEPKLSMEVSKETWVCSKDFIREKEKQPLVKQKVVDFNNPVPVSLQPPSSSCSFSAAPPTAAAAITAKVDEKVVGGKGCEPFVLTRCMSEPMMRSSAKLASNGCKWKNEPTKLGVGF